MKKVEFNYSYGDRVKFKNRGFISEDYGVITENYVNDSFVPMYKVEYNGDIYYIAEANII